MTFPLGTSKLFEENERFSKDVEQKLLGPLGGEKKSKVTSTNLLLATSRVFLQKVHWSLARMSLLFHLQGAWATFAIRPC